MTFSKDVQLDFKLRKDEKALALFLAKVKLSIAIAYLEAFEAVDRALNVATYIINNSGQLKDRKTIDGKQLREKISQTLAESFVDERLRFYFLEGYSPLEEIVSSPISAIEKDQDQKFFNVRVAYTFPVARDLSVEYLFCENENDGKRLLGWTLSEFVSLIKQVKE